MMQSCKIIIIVLMYITRSLISVSGTSSYGATLTNMGGRLRHQQGRFYSIGPHQTSDNLEDRNEVTADVTKWISLASVIKTNDKDKTSINDMTTSTTKTKRSMEIRYRVDSSANSGREESALFINDGHIRDSSVNDVVDNRKYNDFSENSFDAASELQDNQEKLTGVLKNMVYNDEKLKDDIKSDVDIKQNQKVNFLNSDLGKIKRTQDTTDFDQDNTAILSKLYKTSIEADDDFITHYHDIDNRNESPGTRYNNIQTPINVYESVDDKISNSFSNFENMNNHNRFAGIKEKAKSEKSNRDLYGQNLVVFGHIKSGSFIRGIRKCSTYTKVDLFSQYAMAQLASNSGNPLGQLLLYFNMVEINMANYDIALEHIMRILDHFTVTYQGLAMFSVLHSRELEPDDGPRGGYVDTEMHWKLNDAVIAYCNVDYPRCHVIPDLSTITKALNDSYQKDQTLAEYEMKRHPQKQCTTLECQHSSITLDQFITLSELSLEKQLRLFREVFCKVSYHRVIEFTSHLSHVDYEATTPVPTSASLSDGRMGLVLKDILPLDLKKYDKNQPPRFEGNPTTVYFHVTVLSVDSINEESMTYVTDIFLAQSWRDHRLRLPENMTEEYRILDVEWLQKMWRPDCFFKNAKRVTFHEMSVPNHYLWLYHDKTLLYMAKLTLVLSCAMKFESYPHDTQICSMMIESLSHTTHDLMFKWNETDPLVVNPDIELPQLDISRNYTEDCTLNYSTGNFTCLAVVFNLRRRLGYHLFHTYVPSGLTVVMSWISFWIKAEAIPARVTLGVTSLLTLATQNQQSQSSLPPVSYIKAIDVWMSSCTVFVFASLIQFGAVNHFMNQTPVTKDMTGYSLEDLSNYDRKMSEEIELTHRSTSRSRSRGRSPSAPQYVVTRCSGKDIAIYIDKFSRYFFPLAFLVLNISYWSIYGF